jgi:nucleoid-associated protein YgaU
VVEAGPSAPEAPVSAVVKESPPPAAPAAAPAAAKPVAAEPVASKSAPAPASAAPAVAAPTAAAAPSAKGGFVVVARGDTLSIIALRHLGSVFRVSRLLAVNPHITDSSRIYPGEIVRLPASAVAASTGTFDDKDME